MAGSKGKVATEQNEASTVSTTPSSMPFPNSNAGSVTDTPATSDVENEEFHLHQKRSKRTLTTRQKRPADLSLSFSAQPSAKRRAVTKDIYVEIPIRPVNVSVSFALPLRGFDISLSSASKNKGKGKGPSITAAEQDDEIVPDSEDGLGYDQLAMVDETDSDFENSELSTDDDDDNDESDKGIILRAGRKMSYKKASRVKVVDYDDPEEEEEIMFNAAVADSLRYSTYGGASTSSMHASRTVSTRAARAAAAAERRFAMKQGVQIGSDVVLDSDPEGEILTLIDSDDEPIAKKSRSRSGNRKDKKKKRKEKTENDRDSPELDYFSAQREARRHSRLEKQQIRMLEQQLNRRLTYVSPASP